MKKAIASVVIIVVLVGSLAITASARWTYVSGVGNSLSFSGSTAYCYYDIQCYSTYTIKIHSVLQVKKSVLFITWWEDVVSVDRSYYSYSVYDSFTKSGLSGGTYKLVTTFSVYNGSTKLEEITRESEKSL